MIVQAWNLWYTMVSDNPIYKLLQILGQNLSHNDFLPINSRWTWTGSHNRKSNPLAFNLPIWFCVHPCPAKTAAWLHPAWDTQWHDRISIHSLSRPGVWLNPPRPELKDCLENVLGALPVGDLSFSATMQGSWLSVGRWFVSSAEFKVAYELIAMAEAYRRSVSVCPFLAFMLAISHTGDIPMFR